jgi:hypothetical protein
VALNRVKVGVGNAIFRAFTHWPGTRHTARFIPRAAVVLPLCIEAPAKGSPHYNARMTVDLLPPFIRSHYEVHESKHACAILKQDFPQEWNEIVEVLTGFRLRKSWLTVGGGRKSKVSEAIDSELYARGWVEKQFQTEILLDGHRQDSPTHQIDCFKNRVALEIEWNNKDPFYDRDLNNFRLLFDLRAVSVGVIITRCDHLQDIFDELGRGSSFGASTTHMSKLLPRIHGGSGGGCPLLVFGISRALYQED